MIVNYQCYECNKEFGKYIAKDKDIAHKHINIFNNPKRKNFCSKDCKLKWIYRKNKTNKLKS